MLDCSVKKASKKMLNFNTVDGIVRYGLYPIKISLQASHVNGITAQWPLPHPTPKF